MRKLAKKILITGSTSYIGTSLKNYLDSKNRNEYVVRTISLRDEMWHKSDFSKYDVIVHAAAVVHTDEKSEDIYYSINTDLALKVAQKAKAAGVGQFIFLSTIAVYGNVKGGIIGASTPKSPATFYGKSKLKAETAIAPLQDDKFKIAILRPPMIYGDGAKGNYPRLARFSRKIPIFPNFDNHRSMLYIGNLCEFIRLLIDNEESGAFYPQNHEYVKTSEMVRMIANANGKKIAFTTIFNPFIKFLVGRVAVFNKIFGTLVYEQNLSAYKEDYNVYDFKTSIELTELANL
ncbi:UDP-glucose 4-epimerase [Clostridia bacterium]|nr:UDP-glucose 4-epimerase [Clostridia bacterium]